MSGPNSQSSRCGCEYGGPCTRTTVCAVTRVSDEMQEEIDRLTAELAEARSEVMEQARCNGMGAERELKLITERDALAAQVAGMREALDTLHYIYEDFFGGRVPQDHMERIIEKYPRAALAGPTRTAEQPEDALPKLCRIWHDGPWHARAKCECPDGECSFKDRATSPTTAEGTEK